MRFHRGLGLFLVLFGGLYLGLGHWLALTDGPAQSSFEALRRYDAALRHGRMLDAIRMGERTLELAQSDGRWTESQLASLEIDLAGTYTTNQDPYRALELSRIARDRAVAAELTDMALLVDTGIHHTEIALTLQRPLDAACTWGLVLERLGPDRVANPQSRAQPHPEIVWLSEFLVTQGNHFRETKPSAEANDRDLPLTSCQLLAQFYKERDDPDAAAAISDLVVAKARDQSSVGSAIRASLLRHSAQIHEHRGDIILAESRLREAIDVIEATDNTQALLVALDNLASFLTRWGDAERALPILERGLAIRASLKGDRHRDLVGPKMALGYARLDIGDMDGARRAFEDALAIAQSEYGNDPAAALELLLALAEIADEQGRTNDATALRKEAKALEKTNVALNYAFGTDSVKSSPVTHEVLIVSLPFAATGRPAGGRASQVFEPPAANFSLGTVDVFVFAPRKATWRDLWPEGSLYPASDTYSMPMVSSPDIGSWSSIDSMAAVLFVPGQSTSFAQAAGRAAKLQAALGPAFSVVLANWPNSTSVRAFLRNSQNENQSILHLQESVEALLSHSSDGPLAIVAEGRGAYLLNAAIMKLQKDKIAAIRDRLANIALISPDISERDMTDWTVLANASNAKLINYASDASQSLVIAKELYGDETLGLSADRLADISLSETIVIPHAREASFEALYTDRLIDDLSTALRDTSRASNRCGLTQQEGKGLIWLLEPEACAASQTIGTTRGN